MVPMTFESIATIISFCSIEEFFLPQTVVEAKKFSDQVIVVLSDHLFDGSKENLAALEKTFRKCPDATFVIYPFFLPEKVKKKIKTQHMLHNISRIVGMHFLQKDISHVLFLDADEIAEGNRMSAWLKKEDLVRCNAWKFSCYWYFREPYLQAKSLETAALLMKRKKISSKLLWHTHERGGMFADFKGEKKDHVAKEEPLFHHFSWVRSKKNLLKKVRSWGHTGERNWEELIEKEFTHPFQGKDFVHGYHFKEVGLPFAFHYTACQDPVLIKLTSKELLDILFPKKRFFFKRFLQQKPLLK